MDYAGRQARLKKAIAERALDGMYVTDLANIRYLSGFTGSSGTLLVGPSSLWFVTDGRYRVQSAQEVEGAEIEIYRSNDLHQESVKKVVSQLGAGRIGFEADRMSVSDLEERSGWFGGAELVPTKGVVSGLRRVKEPAELLLIRRAAELADAGLAHILERVKPGRTERELALELEFFMRSNGADDVSFDPIVAAAERSALPHAHPTGRPVEEGRFLLFDLGCRYEGYCSDLTRTVVVGRADDRHREIYEIVAKAQRAGLDALAPGRGGVAIDASAREVIESAGFGEAFGHGLGHGVGLEIHEEPSLSKSSTDVISAGEVVTVEPGIYLPELGGVRIEDLVLVGEAGPEVVSAATKELLVL